MRTMRCNDQTATMNGFVGRIRDRVRWDREAAASVAVTVGIIASGLVLTLIFQDDVTRFGTHLIGIAGQGTVDLVVFAVTVVSSTLLTLPIWGYVMVGIASGYDVWHLALVMAAGSATGSFTTMLVGRYLSQTAFIRRRFPRLERHPWTEGRSRLMVTAFLFAGTASPIPCDVFYLACGVKRYPMLLFWVTTAAARVVRYVYLGYAFAAVLEGGMPA